MNEKTLTRTSKFLSFVLRHKPDAIGLELDAAGWADVAELIARVERTAALWRSDDGTASRWCCGSTPRP